MNLNVKDRQGKTVLHLAVKAMCSISTMRQDESEKLIQELVKHGCDINATDEKDGSALCLCCESSYNSEYVWFWND
jgi:ankyrin repeat protein